MLRLRYVFTSEDKDVAIHEYKDWLLRTLLIIDWKFVESREKIFQELSKPNFNPRRTIILEKASTSAQKSVP